MLFDKLAFCSLSRSATEFFLRISLIEILPKFPSPKGISLRLLVDILSTAIA